MCLFCGEAIEPTGTDPCSGVFTTAWSEDDFEKETAEYWFHARCLRMRTHPRVPLYFLDLARFLTGVLSWRIGSLSG